MGRHRSHPAAVPSAALALVALLLVLSAGSPEARATGPAVTPPSAVALPQCSGAPQFSISATPTNGTAPLLVHFTSNLSGGCPPFQVEWEFGDGGGSERANTSHTYLGAGKFFVHVEASGANNFSAERQLTINVTGGLGTPVVHVTVLPASGAAPLSVQAWANVTGGNISDVTNVSWTFGDGGGGHGSYVTHVYVTAGNYTVTASIKPPGLPLAKGTSPVNVTANTGGGGGATVLSLTAVPGIVNVPGNVTLTAALSGTGGPYQLAVCFGDGTACVLGAGGWNGSEDQVFVHSYDSAGNYSIGGTVSTSPGTVVAGASALVIALAAPPLTVNASLIAIETRAPADTQLLASVAGGTPPYAIRWSFGDGSLGSSIPGVAVVHTYRSAGTFVPTVEVQDAGGNVVNSTLPAVIVQPGLSAGALPPTYLGVPTNGLLLVLLLATLVVGIAYGRWYRRRARMRRLRKEGEDIVRELEESP
ncbi:MAG: PKD domain-containing protein [Thermoplasmata archaeon]|nr:PKD domain-containing protein [Thermoplasmata archaeon]